MRCAQFLHAFIRSTVKVSGWLRLSHLILSPCIGSPTHSAQPSQASVQSPSRFPPAASCTTATKNTINHTHIHNKHKHAHKPTLSKAQPTHPSPQLPRNPLTTRLRPSGENGALASRLCRRDREGRCDGRAGAPIFHTLVLSFRFEAFGGFEGVTKFLTQFLMLGALGGGGSVRGCYVCFCV
jgi:hypothetical protein